MAFYKTLYDLTLRLPLNNFARWKPEPKIWNNWLNVEEWLSTINRESLCYSPAHGWGFIFLLTLLGWCRNSSHLLDPNEQQFLQDSLIKGKSCKKTKTNERLFGGFCFMFPTWADISTGLHQNYWVQTNLHMKQCPNFLLQMWRRLSLIFFLPAAQILHIRTTQFLRY